MPPQNNQLRQNNQQQQDKPWKQFDPDFIEFDNGMRDLIEIWQEYHPSHQNVQYGPFTKYFSLKFAEDVGTPQELLWPSALTNKAERIAFAWEEMPTLGDYLSIVDGNEAFPDISFDLLNRGPVQPKLSDGKKYPDFVMSAYFGRNYVFEQELARAAAGGHQTAIRQHERRALWMKPQIPKLIVEIGTLKRGEVFASNNFKSAVFKQLHRYMITVAGPSQNWTIALPTCLRPLGLAIIGIEVAFCTLQMYKDHVVWTAKCGGTRKVKWYLLYGPEFLTAINRLADALTAEVIAAKAEQCRVEAEERACKAEEQNAPEAAEDALLEDAPPEEAPPAPARPAKGKKVLLPRRVQPH